jgi:hypothetical protein
MWGEDGGMMDWERIVLNWIEDFLFIFVCGFFVRLCLVFGLFVQWGFVSRGPLALNTRVLALGKKAFGLLLSSGRGRVGGDDESRTEEVEGEPKRQGFKARESCQREVVKVKINQVQVKHLHIL